MKRCKRSRANYDTGMHLERYKEPCEKSIIEEFRAADKRNEQYEKERYERMKLIDIEKYNKYNATHCIFKYADQCHNCNNIESFHNKCVMPCNYQSNKKTYNYHRIPLYTCKHYESGSCSKHKRIICCTCTIGLGFECNLYENKFAK